MTSPASTILSHVPDASRPALLSSLISALQPNDGPSIDFVASAVAAGEETQSCEDLLGFLQRAIEAGCNEGAVSVAARYPELGGQLFARSAERLSTAKSAEGGESEDGLVESYLRFCKSVFNSIPIQDAHTRSFLASLDLMARGDHKVSCAARDLVFACLSTTNPAIASDVTLPQYPDIWIHVQDLCISDSNKLTQMLGHSLWLRWLLSAQKDDIGQYIDEVYWDALLQGLREGDAEIRKICLNILKVSMSVDDKTTPESRAQFERYATVFETVILGRYINQIQECESDLDDFASDNSLVSSPWLYTLLASALDRQMQESNRKFIGDWITRAQLSSGTEFPAFLQADFLPWAAQGSLFVASLTRTDGKASCLHGERLASYLAYILQQHERVQEAQRIVWSYITAKAFPYAQVYLLKAFEEANVNKRLGPPAIDPTDGSKELPTEDILRGLPQVARDYISSRLTAMEANNASEVASSRRDVLEKEAIAKCANTAEVEGLDDLWTDLEYLEFPKDLLLHVPKALLRHPLLEKAKTDDELASSITDKVVVLQKVAETKTYVLPPLTVSLRSAFVRSPQVYELLNLEDFVARAVDNPPEATIDLMLEEATVHLFANYEDYFGGRPSYGVAALLDLVSRMHDQKHLESLIDRLMERWKAQKVPPPTVSTWKTTLQLQALLLCFENLRPTHAKARELAMDVMHILSIEPLPRYRYLLEWMVVRLIQRMGLEDLVLEQLASKDHHRNPKYLASLMKVGSIIACSPNSGEDFATRLAVLYVPLAASSKIVIRHESQWQIPLLIDHARSKSWKPISENPVLVALDDYIRSMERFHEPPPERKIGRFDPAIHHSFANLVAGAWFALDSTEGPLTSREDFVRLYAQEQLPDGAPEPCLPLGEPLPHQHSPTASTTSAPPARPTPAPRPIDTVSALQTKGTAYLARTLTDPSASQTRPNNLIVVGSLVDNPYNLGGLSRVSEIFGASALTLQNQNVVSNKDFASVSVSSHLHFPIVQLSAAGVPAYLAERKAEGFSVVGIEQTDRSVMLGSEGARLPEKCVLVVGSEKEGIPAVVLTECDVLVEIPQKGVTRSLNVQTAVSVVLFEYARQWGGKP